MGGTPSHQVNAAVAGPSERRVPWIRDFALPLKAFSVVQKRNWVVVTLLLVLNPMEEMVVQVVIPLMSLTCSLMEAGIAQGFGFFLVWGNQSQFGLGLVWLGFAQLDRKNFFWFLPVVNLAQQFLSLRGKTTVCSFGHFVLQELNKQMFFLPTLKNPSKNQELEPQNHPNWKGNIIKQPNFFGLHVCVGPQNLWNLQTLCKQKTGHRSPQKILRGTFFWRFWAWWSFAERCSNRRCQWMFPVLWSRRWHRTLRTK